MHPSALDRPLSAAAYGYLPHATSVRSINRARIISLVRLNPGIMRADLSRLSGLSKGTVSALVDELLDEDFLFEDTEEGTRQRRNGLHLNRDAGVAIGFELWSDECRAIVTDVGMRVLRRLVRPMKSRAVQPAIDLIVDMHQELLAGLGLPCLGTFVGLPGPSDPSGKMLIIAESLGWSDVPLGTVLSKRLGWPVALINRPRAALLGEYWYGAGVGVQDIVEITVSSGIGAGIMLGGQLISGGQGIGCEVGHTTILADGPLCQCGNRGCLETVSSMPAIIDQVWDAIQRGAPLPPGWPAVRQAITYRHIIDSARDGDAVVLNVVRQASQYIGIAVANLIDILNPRLFIVGGQLAEIGESVVNVVRETAQRRAFPLSFRNVEIVGGKLGADAVCIGACALVIERYVAEYEPALRAGTYAAPLVSQNLVRE